MPTREEIFKTVTTTLVDALGIEEDEVKPKATLSGDLGAESIDFLDIVFRLEKNLGIKIPRGDLFLENVFTDPKYVQGGKVTEEGLTLLRERLPHADVDQFAEDPDVQKLSDLFTVEMIVRYIESKVSSSGG